MLNSLVFDEARYQRLLEGAATLVGDGEWPDAEEVRSLISCIDNTTLNGNDTEASVSAFVRRTMELQQGAVPPVAAICVYPYFVPLVKQLLGTGPIAVAAVAGGFPAGQLPLPLKVAEVKAVVEMGADEVDYVINRGAYLTGLPSGGGPGALEGDFGDRRAPLPCPGLQRCCGRACRRRRLCQDLDGQDSGRRHSRGGVCHADGRERCAPIFAKKCGF